ncbi:MAG TPA: YdeI/OmpD-associated family protein [Longimicrobiales bacterium]|nr:YdeI/OmpD-associated family protein [Longimicrobiales bacterium]
MARLTIGRVIEFASVTEWEVWLEDNHASESEVWLRFAKKGSEAVTVSRGEALIEAGRMRPAGMAAVEAAKADGRWDAAYPPPSRIEVPEDLREALKQNPKAEDRFQTLDAQNRYAILYRIHEAKRPDTRARRIETFVGMLERGEKIH